MKVLPMRSTYVLRFLCTIFTTTIWPRTASKLRRISTPTIAPDYVATFCRSVEMEPMVKGWNDELLNGLRT